MNIQTIANTLKTNNVKAEVITTILGYKMALVKLNKVTFPQLLEIVANSELNNVVEVKSFGKQAMVYVPGSNE